MIKDKKASLHKDMIGKPELIAPAGDPEKLEIAFLYGADAVYASTPKYSMRTREIGFTDETLRESIQYAHKLGKKVYLTVNVFPYPGEIEDLKKHLERTIALQPDAIIVADPGVLTYIKSISDIPVHLSTQANTTNHLSAEFWHKAGAERIVLARELSLKDIKLISKHCTTENNNSTIQQSNNLTAPELECFVQGAMCMAYSGRCQISNYMIGRDPNKGACVQACRFKYRLYEMEDTASLHGKAVAGAGAPASEGMRGEMRKGEKFQVYEDEYGSYILNSKDLCMIEYLPELVEAGIGSFKIEGRLKSIYYVGMVTRAWRRAIDLYFENPAKYEKEKINFKNELSKVSNRGFTTGFYFHKPTQNTNNYQASRADSEWGFIGLGKDYNTKSKLATIEVKNYLPKGAKLEIVTPEKIIKYKLDTIFHKGKKVAVAHANYIIEIPIDEEIVKNSFLRMKLGQK